MIRRKPGEPNDSSTKKRSPWVPGLLEIKIKQDTVSLMPDSLRAASISFAKALPSSFFQPFDGRLQRKEILEVIPLFSSPPKRTPTNPSLTMALSFTRSVRDVTDPDLAGINLLRIDPTVDLDLEVQRLKEIPGVEYCEKVPRRWLTASPAAARAPAVAADPMINRQWNLRAVEWFQAHPLPDASHIKVAILDTGIDTRHPDLPSPAAYRHSRKSAIDIVGHGTHVAGIIAARTNNSIGIAGISNPELHVWKVFEDEPDDDDHKYYVDDTAYKHALENARRFGMQVVNLSLGAEFPSSSEKMLVRKLVDAGAILVAAIGNEYLEGNPIEYPAALPGVIAVGATDSRNRRASTSNTGSHIALAAPGVDILSTLPLRRSDARTKDEVEYFAWDGTSFAAPHVAAAAALLLAKNPHLDLADITKILKKTATSVPGAKKDAVGAGVLSIKASLEAAGGKKRR